jgi:F-type H+-transporting ATPase subunit a
MNRFLLCCWLLVLGFLGAATLRAQGKEQSTPAKAEAAHGQQGGQQDHPQLKTLAMGNSEYFNRQYDHSIPYPVALKDTPFAIYNVNVFQWIALGLMLLIFLPVRASFARSGAPSRLVRIFRGWCHWIRDEMVYPVMGKEEGNRFAPYFIFLFFFVAFMNCIGLIPSSKWFSTYTATGTPYVTGALALCTLVTMLFFGMRQQGVWGFFKNLLPHGLPIALIPLMAVVELVGLLVKPFALTIRLFANMLAGHLVIASLIGLIFLFTKLMGGSPIAYATAVPAVGMAVFIFIIEAFVTLLQAYIFTYLSIIFLQLAMHPDH